jgi:hypothetical protein
MTEEARCALCGRKIEHGRTPEGRRVTLDLEHPVFTPVALRDREGRVREELTRTTLHLAQHVCPKAAEA